MSAATHGFRARASARRRVSANTREAPLERSYSGMGGGVHVAETENAGFIVAAMTAQAQRLSSVHVTFIIERLIRAQSVPSSDHFVRGAHFAGRERRLFTKQPRVLAQYRIVSHHHAPSWNRGLFDIATREEPLPETTRAPLALLVYREGVPVSTFTCHLPTHSFWARTRQHPAENPISAQQKPSATSPSTVGHVRNASLRRHDE